MKITKRDLLRIIAEESNAISAEKVLEEGTVEDIESAVAKAVQEFIAMNNREPSMADVNMIVNMVMDHGDEGLVDLEAAPEFDPGSVSGKDIAGTGRIKKGRLGDADYPLKESIRKLVRKHTKAPERLALEESIRRSLRTVLTQD